MPERRLLETIVVVMYTGIEDYLTDSGNMILRLGFQSVGVFTPLVRNALVQLNKEVQ